MISELFRRKQEKAMLEWHCNWVRSVPELTNEEVRIFSERWQEITAQIWEKTMKFKDMKVGEKFRFPGGVQVYTKVAENTCKDASDHIYHCLPDLEFVPVFSSIDSIMPFGSLPIGKIFRYLDTNAVRYIKTGVEMCRPITFDCGDFIQCESSRSVESEEKICFNELEAGAKFRFIGDRTVYIKDQKKLGDLEIGERFKFPGKPTHYIKTGAGEAYAVAYCTDIKNNHFSPAIIVTPLKPRNNTMLFLIWKSEKDSSTLKAQHIISRRQRKKHTLLRMVMLTKIFIVLLLGSWFL